MLTFFTTGKPFCGHDGVIQRNALKSWKLLHPDIEVILFGDEAGAAEICGELGLVHQPNVERHECKKPRLDSMFAKAQAIAKHEYLCYSNCDIILTADFLVGFEKAVAWRKRLLMVSQRWDTDITEAIDFDQADWELKLLQQAQTRGSQQNVNWVDFFLFRKGMYADMPPLIVGHCYWDHWMIWKALFDGVAVLDASRFLVPVHQNHGYDPEFGRTKGFPLDPLSLMNLAAIGGRNHLRKIDAATHRLTQNGKIRPILFRYSFTMQQRVEHVSEKSSTVRIMTYRLALPVWHAFLGITRPLRSTLGMRSRALKQGPLRRQ
jgi:hypothetical protein